MNYHLMTPAEALAAAQENILGVGAVAIAVLALLIWRVVKRGKADKLATAFAVAVATVFSADGMYEVATDRLHLAPSLALVVFGVAEAAMLAEATRAARLHARTGSLGVHGRAVWTIAVCAGVIVSLNGTSIIEFLLRLGMPVLVAALWWLGYQNEATRTKLAGAISWTISPRRVLVWLRLAEPGDVTVNDAATERLTKQMTIAGFKLHATISERAKARKTYQLQLMTLKATDDVADEVAARIARAYSIVDRTAPGAAVDPTEQAKADKRTQDRQDRRITALVRREMAKLEASAVLPVSPPPAGPMAPSIVVPTAAEIKKLVNA